MRQGHHVCLGCVERDGGIRAWLGQCGKDKLQIGKQKLAIKLYSAVEDRTVRFHLLHAKDQAPVEQHIIRKDTGDEVGKEDMRKALALSRADGRDPAA